MSREPHRRILVALDTPEIGHALELIAALQGRVGGFKVGLQLFTRGGPDVVRAVRDSGSDVFLDLKLHDIPNTVAGAAAAIARLGVAYFTVHASGGAEMIRRGVQSSAESAAAEGLPAPCVLAVTVLTSHDEQELRSIGLQGPAEEAVLRLAALARDAGAGGVVCSPLEVAAVRAIFADGRLVVPGIRPASGEVHGDDQSRTATPAGAVAEGADLLVIGRPITRASDPAAAASRIAAEIADA